MLYIGWIKKVIQVIILLFFKLSLTGVLIYSMIIYQKQRLFDLVRALSMEPDVYQ